MGGELDDALKSASIKAFKILQTACSRTGRCKKISGLVADAEAKPRQQ
jgi:hypothetical protein